MKYLYIVHSDEDENNIMEEFEKEEEAIEYAKDCGNCWVDKIPLDDGEAYYDDAETIWSYIEEE